MTADNLPPRPDPLGMEEMTLRDFFAAQALAGILASYTRGPLPTEDEAAEQSYHYADAMLRQRAA